MLETKKPFGILRFEEGWSKEQKKAVDAVTLEYGLQVFSYPAVSSMLTGEGEEIGLVSFYAVDGRGNMAMLVRDLVDGPTCAFDIKLKPAKQKTAPVEWGINVWGTRKSDFHWVNGDKPLLKTKDWTVGNAKFTAPLADFTRKDVLDGLKRYGIDWQTQTETEDLGNISACTLCLRSTTPVICPKTGSQIDAVKWSPQENLGQVRKILEQ